VAQTNPDKAPISSAKCFREIVQGLWNQELEEEAYLIKLLQK
jgi:hypothetical protein